jgi:hypothetical protein
MSTDHPDALTVPVLNTRPGVVEALNTGDFKPGWIDVITMGLFCPAIMKTPLPGLTETFAYTLMSPELASETSTPVTTNDPEVSGAWGGSAIDTVLLATEEITGEPAPANAPNLPVMSIGLLAGYDVLFVMVAG